MRRHSERFMVRKGIRAVLMLGLVAGGCQSEAERAPAVNTAAGQQTTAELARLRARQTSASEIAPGIFQVMGTGNTTIVLTETGHVVLDAGLPADATKARELFAGIADGPASHVVVTHAHADHYGGASQWMGEGTELIAHREFMNSQAYLSALGPYLMRRNRIFFPEDVPDLPEFLTAAALKLFHPHAEPTILFQNGYDFEAGGRHFEVIHTPGAEGSDSISIWMPDEKILFTGDLFGPLFPMWPNLNTLRGEKIRQAMPYIESLNRVLDLEPAMLVPGHFEPIRGKERIRVAVERMRNAVQYVHDETIAGMNAGKTLYELMAEIRLPEELKLSEGHGKVSWGVKSIWEGYSGWFGLESTTELYAVAQNAVHAEVVAMAGGAATVATRARARLDAGRPVEALHLLDMALHAEPANQSALRVRLAALEDLLSRSGGENHFEVYWLRHRIAATDAALDR
jgi:alkyl sulfatase BDS1-like metallo-beta-lactamase superfamily hydrolase